MVWLSFLSCGNLRGGEALGVAKAVSPPRAPPLRPRIGGAMVLAMMRIGGAMDDAVLTV